MNIENYIQNQNGVNKCYVYWIYNNDCIDISKHGYIGVTKHPDIRSRVHERRNKNIPKNVTMKIIFVGTRQECFDKELEFRPTAGIGWNKAIGGSHGWQTGFIHSEETKQKMKEKWTEDRKKATSKATIARNKSMKGQKRPKQSKSISGSSNPMYGKTHSRETRKKISEINKNRTDYKVQENYCIFCKQRASISIIKKYHGKGRKNCEN